MPRSNVVPLRKLNVRAVKQLISEENQALYSPEHMQTLLQKLPRDLETVIGLVMAERNYYAVHDPNSHTVIAMRILSKIALSFSLALEHNHV